MINVANATAKWARNLQGAVQSYKDGISSVTENPMQLAAAQQDKALQNYTAMMTSGAWANKMNSMPLDAWKAPALNIGAQRLASGVAKGTPKMQAALTKFAPAYEQARQIARSTAGSGKSRALAVQSAVYDIMKQAAGKPIS